MSSADFFKFLRNSEYKKCYDFLEENPDNTIATDADPQGEMTIFMHAIHTGQLDLVKAILASIKNKKEIINYTIHEAGYTPLMMSVLTGNADLVRYLLDNGADRNVKNKIDKSAAELAAFTGHNEIAAIITSRIDKVISCPFISELVTETCLAPAFIALKYKYAFAEIVKNAGKLLDLAGSEPYPFNAKCLYLYQVVQTINEAPDHDKFIKQQTIIVDKSASKPVQYQTILKCLQKVKDRCSEYRELLQTVSSISKFAYHGTALQKIEEDFCFIKVRKQSERCDTCFKPEAKKCCCRCKTRYCGSICQEYAWFRHRKFCKQIAEDDQSPKEKPQISM